MAANPAIESIEPNVRHWPTAVPNDPRYPSQWELREAVGGLNIEPAWDHSMGSGIVIAVIDTGRTAHPDLDAKTVPGYDFISNAAEARDGSGRDGDPSDMGTWNGADECGAGEPAKDSREAAGITKATLAQSPEAHPWPHFQDRARKPSHACAAVHPIRTSLGAGSSCDRRLFREHSSGRQRGCEAVPETITEVDQSCSRWVRRQCLGACPPTCRRFTGRSGCVHPRRPALRRCRRAGVPMQAFKARRPCS